MAQVRKKKSAGTINDPLSISGVEIVDDGNGGKLIKITDPNIMMRSEHEAIMGEFSLEVCEHTFETVGNMMEDLMKKMPKNAPVEYKHGYQEAYVRLRKEMVETMKEIRKLDKKDKIQKKGEHELAEAMKELSSLLGVDASTDKIQDR